MVSQVCFKVLSSLCTALCQVFFGPLSLAYLPVEGSQGDVYLFFHMKCSDHYYPDLMMRDDIRKRCSIITLPVMLVYMEGFRAEWCICTIYHA